jgi:hypothetical protein
VELAPVLLELGEAEEAQQRLEAAREVSETSGARSLQARALAALAHCRRRQGEEPEARDLARAAWEMARPLAMAPFLESLERDWPELAGEAASSPGTEEGKNP